MFQEAWAVFAPSSMPGRPPARGGWGWGPHPIQPLSPGLDVWPEAEDFSLGKSLRSENMATLWIIYSFLLLPELEI